MTNPNEPSWDDIFRSPDDEPARPATPLSASPEPTVPGYRVRASDPFAVAAAEAQTSTRRERREQTGGEPGGPPSDTLTRRELREQTGGRGRDGRIRKRRVWPWVLVALLALGIGGVATVWVAFEDRIRDVLGWEEPDDYTGDGNGTDVEVTITAGQIGEDVAQSLADAGVTKSFDAFYDLLLSLGDSAPAFAPGTYRLEEEMSAQAALDALQDPENVIINAVNIREGLTIPEYVELLAAGTGIPAADFEAALVDPASYGIPAEAPNFEGYLFPANYQFDPGLDARGIVQQLINRTFQSLDAAGVPVEQRHTVLTIASLIQREARLPDDFYKVSRVIQNRLAQGMRLEFDSTAHYGAGGSTGSVFTTDEERAAVNDYNTYVIPALPIGPIAGAGDRAIDAAMHPADGPWMFFVTVNLETGETVFTETVAQHEAAVEQLRAWCRDTDHPACG